MSRPKLNRTEPLRLSFTEDELNALLKMAAAQGYRSVRDWARDTLLGYFHERTDR